MTTSTLQRALACCLTVGLLLPMGRAWGARSTFAPPRGGMQVRIDRIDAARFPRLEASISLAVGQKLDFRRLREENLSIIEEEIPIDGFRIEPFFPQLALSIVADDSGSVENQIRYVKDAAFALVDQLARYDELSLVGFERKVEVMCPLTTDRTKLRRAVGRLKAYGATALNDGLMLGLAQIARAEGKRTVLLITDGEDQVYAGGRPLSLADMRQVVNQARAIKAEIYAIGIGPHVDEKLLKRLAQETGGRYYYTPSHKHLRPLLLDLARSFQSKFRVTWQSPNPRFAPLERDVIFNVNFEEHRGRGLGVYWLNHRPREETVQINRSQIKGLGLCKLRLFTRSLGERFFETIFYLYDGKGEIIRYGRTTDDGFGRLDRDDPELVDLQPGTYKLVLRVPGSEINFVHPHVVLAPSTTNTMTLDFSKLEFRRLGGPWFDLHHPYGDTCEHMSVKLVDMAADEVIYAGLLVDFRKNARDLGVWLQEGAYRVVLDNVWKLDEENQAKHCVLSNKLEAEFQVAGGKILKFDMAAADFLEKTDVLSDEYLHAHAEESPFDRFKPRNDMEMDRRVRMQRERYLAGDFGRNAQALHDEGRMYGYVSPEEADRRIGGLLDRYGRTPQQEIPVPDVDDKAFVKKHIGDEDARDRRLSTLRVDYTKRRRQAKLHPDWPSRSVDPVAPDAPEPRWPQRVDWNRQAQHRQAMAGAEFRSAQRRDLGEARIQDKVEWKQRDLARAMRDERIAERTRKVRSDDRLLTNAGAPQSTGSDVTAPDGAYAPREGAAERSSSPRSRSRRPRGAKATLEALRSKVRARQGSDEQPADDGVSSGSFEVEAPAPSPSPAKVGIEGHADRLDQLIGTLEEKYGK